MPKIYRSAVIAAPIEKVWPHVRDFGAIHKIASGLASSTDIAGGETADKVGCVRNIHLKDGGVIVERLIALSDHEHSQTYTILESPLGVSDYIATIRALPLTESGGTFVDWTADFGCEPGRETELSSVIGDGVFAAGLANLKTLV